MKRPRVVIVGGGFGGIEAAKALRRAPVDVTVIDRNNHYVFQPLLYQVATADLAPGQIAAPIRQILHRQRNTDVLMAEVVGIDLAARRVEIQLPGQGSSVERKAIPFDALIISTGVNQSYFGHDEFARYAPPLKTLEDATAVRSGILHAFELAEAEDDAERRAALLTFVLVGGGPTGVEMAGALAELSRVTMARDFRHIDPSKARIILVEAGPRILPTFAEDLAESAARRLRAMGVEIRVGIPVSDVDAEGVRLGAERIGAASVLWTAGVKPSPAGSWLGAETDRAGRVKVGRDMSLPGHPEVFVVGDVAAFEQDGKQLPGVAQVAMQQGRFAGKVLKRRLAGTPSPGEFRYFDKGNMAVVGRNFALLEAKKLHLSGILAWLVWALIHINYLAQFNNKLLVMAQWAWSYLTRQRGSRLILGRH
jgi:NADH dehydrogenase FAD-containing subunit